MTIDLEITALGAQGDGIAATVPGERETPRFVAFALPGERVRVDGDGPPSLISPPNPDRAQPLCRHFGVCGGCAAQHMGDRLYAEWKRAIVVEAFRQRGLAPDIAPLHRVAPGTRRRAVLTGQRRHDGHAILGYHRRKSPDLVDIEECPVLAPAIVDALPALRTIVALLPGSQARLTVLATAAGLDVSVEHEGHRLGAAGLASLARIAAEQRIARVSLNGETVLGRAEPALLFGGIAATPPPGAFVQAVEAAEVEMTRLVAAAALKSKRVADLFSGIGTLALPLARRSRVLAIDSDPAALAALDAAARRAQGLKPIATKVRDLFQHPLAVAELRDFDAVVFDPPRAGARAQAERLAKSAVPLAIAVSCDPGTLARDARTLVDGGYRLEAVTPIDQFLFSPHVEAVAVFRR